MGNRARAPSQEVDLLAPFKGTLGNDSATLLAALEANSAYRRELMRLWTYASNLRNTNLAASEGQEMVGRIQALSQSASAAQSFFVPEIVSLGEERIMAYIAAEPGLEKHSLYLRDALRQGEHVLSPESEQVLSLMATALSASQSARDILANAEIDWPLITLSDGAEVRIDNAGYGLHRQASNRADRVAVFNAFWGTWKKYESTLGAALNGEVQANVATATARGYENTLAFFLSGDNLPTQVYRTLLRSLTIESMLCIGISDSVPECLVLMTLAITTSIRRSLRLTRPFRSRKLGKPFLRRFRCLVPIMVACSRLLPDNAGCTCTLKQENALVLICQAPLTTYTL